MLNISAKIVQTWNIGKYSYMRSIPLFEPVLSILRKDAETMKEVRKKIPNGSMTIWALLSSVNRPIVCFSLSAR